MLFGKKLKLIVAIGIIAAIIGGAVGGLRIAANITYDAELIIYTSHVDDNNDLLYALRSGVFAEKLLLEKNGLPPKDKCNAADYEAAQKALAEFEAAREKLKEKNEEVRTHYISDIESKYQALQNEYDLILEALMVYKESPDEGDGRDENHKEKVAYYEELLLVAEKERKDYYDVYYAKAIEKKKELEKELSQARDDVRVKRDLADEALEKVIAPLRDDASMRKQVQKINKYVTYSHLESVNAETMEEKADAVDMNKKYIKINISIPKREALAKEILGFYKLHLCDYVEKYLEDTAGAIEGECTIANPTAEVERNPKSLMGEIAKYAVVFAVVGAALTYLGFVVHLLAKTSPSNQLSANDQKNQATEKEQE